MQVGYSFECISYSDGDNTSQQEYYIACNGGGCNAKYIGSFPQTVENDYMETIYFEREPSCEAQEFLPGQFFLESIKKTQG